jgi:hypothetical protein
MQSIVSEWCRAGEGYAGDGETSLSTLSKALSQVGIKLLGLLLTWSAGQPLANRMGWQPDIHWLARDEGGLVAAMFEAWDSVESADGA